VPTETVFSPSFCKIPPFTHQVEDAQKLINNPYFAIYSEMGTGKSATVILAACTLSQAKKIDAVVIVAPASVRSVWIDSDIGEIRKHCFIPTCIVEFHSKSRTVWSDENPQLMFIVTNYELLRSAKHLDALIKLLEGYSVFLVCDEASFIKSRTAQQSKAIKKLRASCRRAVILTGTPITHSPLDLFSQMQVLSNDILGDSYWKFRARYAEMVPKRFGNGATFQQVVGYKNLDELQKRVAPYCVRRLKQDCLSLPPKLYTQREVALTPESWKRYQQLKKEAVIALGNGDMRLEPNAAVRIMRLAQLTSGHLGGYVVDTVGGVTDTGMPETVDYSSEKLDWCVQYLTQECTASHVIIWTRWRRERERLFAALGEGFWVGQIYGGQSKREREIHIQEFSECNDKVCHVLLAQPHAGGFGLNLQVASEEWFLSNDWSYGVRLQAEDRAHRPGQTKSVLIGDVLATGPAGQRTIDHIILKALRDKADLAAMTTAAWRKELSDDF
jgi:SNF2 family DNA or RNA helicase